MAKLEQVKVKKEMDPRFLAVILDKDFQKQRLEDKERSMVEVFEKGLEGELSTSDTIEKTVEKIVKMALTCEFGAALVTKPGAKKMVSFISRGILSERELRRSALIIADRFATSRKTKVIPLRGRKAVING